MHAHAFDFVAQALQYLQPDPATVVEIGSRNVNGSIRPLFRNARVYVGVDVQPGPDVDVVADGATVSLEALSPVGEVVELAEPIEGAPDTAAGDVVELGPELFDVAVSCEVLEHTPAWREIVANMARLVRPGGGIIVTCAGPTRRPHSAVDGGALRAGEYYGNVEAEELKAAANAAGVRALHCVERPDRGDVYLVGLVEG